MEKAGEMSHAKHDWPELNGYCVPCLIEKLDAALIEIREVTAHRDRLRDIGNDVRRMILTTCFETSPSQSKELAVRILRRIDPVEPEEGIFCLEHSKVMVDGVCPKCSVEA